MNTLISVEFSSSKFELQTCTYLSNTTAYALPHVEVVLYQAVLQPAVNCPKTHSAFYHNRAGPLPYLVRVGYRWMILYEMPLRLTYLWHLEIIET